MRYAPILLLALLGLATHAAAQPSAPLVVTTASARPSLQPALDADNAELAVPLEKARRTLSQAKKRYQAGLAAGQQLLLTVRVYASDTTFRQVQARVLSWQGPTVQGMVGTGADSAGPPAAQPEVSLIFPESAVLDWTIVAANGREEGNYVGKYLDAARGIEALQLR